ncbi:hypothetical protein B0T26DRAFT_756748 [Lasiosphaeria miniovina]|uniref:Uncharacterized protein n=1 Tax=Lasiosphaeria miniovina TaxID=1954250 RepID=A0AA39ZT76_9PEZI|nr:uncharacterized protein B0T26DRAFT_756748 [Lasiosphaeria miniovina]KAK0703182.1 hypothetical protein B0T26DRAFT_756748 [Lasiosphaeria miniovina]
MSAAAITLPTPTDLAAAARPTELPAAISAAASASIDDRKSATPRLQGFLHAVPIIARERGICGFF